MLTIEDYNKIHAEDDMDEYNKGIYYVRNRMIEGFFLQIPNYKDFFVLELGCSYGFLAEIIQSHRNNPVNYYATNFSDQVVNKMVYKLMKNKYNIPIKYQSHILNYKDSKSWLIDINRYNKNTLYISCSLEHFEEDLKFIEEMPLASYGIFSVPNFDSKGHYRYFCSFEEIENRYEHLLEFKHKGEVTIYYDEKKITKFVFVGVRRD